MLLSGIYGFIQYINNVSIDHQLTCLIQFQYFLMVYSNAKLKNNSDKPSPFLWIRNASNGYLPVRTLLQVSFKHICINPTNFNGMQIQWQHCTLLVCWLSDRLLEIYKSMRQCPIILPFFYSIGRVHIIWSIFDLLRRNLHRWSPVISSTYVVDLERKMLGKIYFVVGKTDIPL
jgi:hypothetical protein